MLLVEGLSLFFQDSIEDWWLGAAPDLGINSFKNGISTSQNTFSDPWRTKLKFHLCELLLLAIFGEEERSNYRPRLGDDSPSLFTEECFIHFTTISNPKSSFQFCKTNVVPTLQMELPFALFMTPPKSSNDLINLITNNSRCFKVRKTVVGNACQGGFNKNTSTTLR